MARYMRPCGLWIRREQDRWFGQCHCDPLSAPSFGISMPVIEKGYVFRSERSVRFTLDCCWARLIRGPNVP
jgi:hypothetical protein